MVHGKTDYIRHNNVSKREAFQKRYMLCERTAKVGFQCVRLLMDCRQGQGASHQSKI